jgi:hypothetical protein
MAGEIASIMVHSDVPKTFTAEAAQHGMRTAIAIHQPEAGKRIRSLVSVGTTDPLETFTDAGIAMLVPGLAEISRSAATYTDEDWIQMHRQQTEDRLRAAITAMAGRRL